jgi:hypothetical protein
MLSERRPSLPTDKERAERYLKHVEHFRQMAETEPVEGIREQLHNLARDYEELAERLLHLN